MDYVFIIGMARTGSSMYMNILNNHTSINISDELHFILPHYLRIFRKDVVSVIQKEIGDLNDDSNIEKLLDLMYSKRLDGVFWQSKDGIMSIDREQLKTRLLQSASRTYKDILMVLLEEHAKAKNKEVAGAKFPINIKYAHILFQWFPEAKFVHIIRDPRAIYPSLFRNHLKYLTSKYNFPMLRDLFKYVTKIGSFLYLIDQYKAAARIHKEYHHLDNYLLLRFEDVISQPEFFIKQLCTFLGVEYTEKMLLPPNLDSAYGSSGKMGFQKEVLWKWKKHISPTTEKLIKVSLREEMKLFGYL